MARRAGKIDWEAARQRLTESEAALARGVGPDPERLAALYRERATRLARRTTGADQAPTIPVITFTLGAGRYGFPLVDVARVESSPRYTPVPGSPPELLGVLNLRGEIRPLAHLRRLLGHTGPEVQAPHALVLRSRGGEVAVAVDAVLDVRQLARDDLTEDVTSEGKTGGTGVKGVTSDMLVLLSADVVLAHPLFRASEEIERAEHETAAGENACESN